MDLGAFTFNSQDLNKYVCLINEQSLFRKSSHVTAEFVYINGSNRKVPPVKWEHLPRYWPFVRGIHRSPEFTSQRPVTWSFDVFFDLRLNKRLSKQSRRW